MANIQNLFLTAFITGKIDLKRYILVTNLIHANIDKEKVFFNRKHQNNHYRKYQW